MTAGTLVRNVLLASSDLRASLAILELKAVADTVVRLKQYADDDLPGTLEKPGLKDRWEGL